jgi:hypothetical protein
MQKGVRLVAYKEEARKCNHLMIAITALAKILSQIRRC